jgi:hypothetical protein
MKLAWHYPYQSPSFKGTPGKRGVWDLGRRTEIIPLPAIIHAPTPEENRWLCRPRPLHNSRRLGFLAATRRRCADPYQAAAGTRLGGLNCTEATPHKDLFGWYCPPPPPSVRARVVVTNRGAKRACLRVLNVCGLNTTARTECGNIRSSTLANQERAPLPLVRFKYSNSIFVWMEWVMGESD